MATQHVVSSSSTSSHHLSSNSSSGVVGIHYRVGRKIGEGSFGVIFEGRSNTKEEEGAGQHPRHGTRLTWVVGCVWSGTNLLNSQTIAIKFVSSLN